MTRGKRRDRTARELPVGKVPRDYRRLFKAATAAGWRIEARRGGHFALWPPDDAPPVFCASSPGDRRAMHHVTADLRRSGLDV